MCVVNTNKKLKSQIVEGLTNIFDSYSFVVVCVNKGLKVSQVRELRRKVKASSGGYLVAKNTLSKIAMNSSKRASSLAEKMQGPTTIAYSNDSVAMSKLLADFAKANETLELKAAVLDGVLLDKAKIDVLASLPSLDELRARIVGIFAAPATKIAQLIQAPASQLARVVSAYSKKE